MKVFFGKYFECFQIILSLIFTMLGLVLNFDNSIFNVILFGLAYLCVGAEVIKRTIVNIFNRIIFDENTLMAIASIGAFCIGEYTEAIAVVILYKIGTFLQSKAVNKTRKSISDLMDLPAQYANIISDDGTVSKTDAYNVERGMKLLVKAGEKIPVDAIILKGQSHLDSSSITGESSLKEVCEGDKVLSGCINVGGTLEIEAITDYYDSTASKILEMVEEASTRKSKCENFISKFAKYYTPIVVLISALIILVPYLFFDQDFGIWLHRGLVFLVVSCPCALVISVPLSFFGGIGALSKMGVMFKGSNYVEMLARANIIAFDKTGTITNGEFEVANYAGINCNESDLLNITMNIENCSNHSVAQAIAKYCKKKLDANAKVINFDNITEIPGFGMSVNYQEDNYLIGNAKLMIKNDIKIIKVETPNSVIYVSKNKNIIGYFVISDNIKPNVKESIQSLKGLNIDKVMLLSGDNLSSVEFVANKLGIKKYYGELLPNEKVEKIDAVKKGNNIIAFVGDGINDAPVLTLADIGISMGGIGSDSAIEASDVVIMDDDISKIPKAIKKCRYIMRIVKENIAFALSIKFIVLLLSIFGFATMWMAVFADVGVTILAIFNSLRSLKRIN